MKPENIIYIKGETLNLCVPQKELHKDLYLTWLNDPDINKYLLRGVFPLTSAQEDKWFEENDDPKENITFAITTKEGVTIGNVGLNRINHISRTAEAGTFIGEKKEWGKGYGSEAKRMIVEYGFKELNLRKIFVNVSSDNIASIKANQKAGLKKEAILKKHLWNKGKYSDVIILSIFKN